MAEDAGSVLRAIRQRHATKSTFLANIGLEAVEIHQDRGVLLDLVDAARREAERWRDVAWSRTGERLPLPWDTPNAVSGGRPEGTG